MKKYSIIILIIFVALSLLLINKNNQTKSTTNKPVVNIGAILPITGKVANLGEGAKNAMMMAMEDINSLPHNKYQYEIIFEDDMLEAKKTAIAAHKLINVNKTQALVTYFSGAGLVANPIATQNKVLHFGETWHPDAAQGHYNFIHFTQIEAQVEKYIELIKHLKIKKLAILSASRAGSIKTAEDVRDIVANIDDMEVVFFDKFHKGEKQFTTLIEKAKSLGADHYYIQALSPELEILVKQMHDLGIKNRNISTIACFDTSEHKDMFNGGYEITISDYADEFNARYIKSYNMEPSYGTGFAYDIIKLIHYGFENTTPKAGEILPTNFDVVNTIHRVENFPSAVSEITIDEQGLIHSIPTFRRVENGKMISYDLKDIK